MYNILGNAIVEATQMKTYRLEFLAATLTIGLIAGASNAAGRASSAGSRQAQWSDEDREAVTGQLARAFNSSLRGDPEFRRDALEKISQGQCIVRLADDGVDVLYDESAILTIEARWLKKNQLIILDEDGTDLDDDDNPWGSALISLPRVPRAPQPWAVGPETPPQEVRRGAVPFHLLEPLIRAAARQIIDEAASRGAAGKDARSLSDAVRRGLLPGRNFQKIPAR